MASALIWTLIVLDEVTAVTQGADVTDIVRAAARKRNDVVFCPHIAVSAVGTLGDFFPISPATGATSMCTKCHLPL